MHRLADPGFFEQLALSHQKILDRTAEALAAGSVERPADARSQLFRLSRTLACISLVLRRGDEEALGHFRRAVAIGQVMVQPALAGGTVDYLEYTTALALTVAFGSVEDIEQVVAVPEEAYQPGEPLASSDVAGLAQLSAWRHWLASRDEEARKAARAALKLAQEAAEVTAAQAFDAILHGRGRAFARHIEERLFEYAAQYRALPEDAEGFVCLQALALCRMAYNEGIQLEDAAYLPVRLLPNYRSGRTEYETTPPPPSFWSQAIHALRFRRRA